MLQLVKIFVDMCLFRAKPEQLPYSLFLLLLTIITYMAAGMVVSLVNQTMAKAVLIVIVDTAMLLGLAYAGLWIRGFLNRGVKTITAILGTGTLFTLMGLPLMLLLHDQPADQPSFYSLLVLVLMVWNIGVLGHILRSALSMPMWVGTSIALLYVYTSIRILAVLSIA